MDVGRERKEAHLLLVSGRARKIQRKEGRPGSAVGSVQPGVPSGGMGETAGLSSQTSAFPARCPSRQGRLSVFIRE